jgi:hypothetical protein
MKMEQILACVLVRMNAMEERMDAILWEMKAEIRTS